MWPFFEHCHCVNFFHNLSTWSRSALLKEERNELARAQLSCLPTICQYLIINFQILILFQFFLIQSRHSSRCYSTKAESSGLDKTIREFDGNDSQQERRSSPRAIQATRSTSCSLEQSMWSRSCDKLGTWEEGPAQWPFVFTGSLC